MARLGECDIHQREHGFGVALSLDLSDRFSFRINCYGEAWDFLALYSVSMESLNHGLSE